MIKETRINSLVFKILVTVIIGCISLAILTSAVNFAISKEIFINNFAETQTKIFNKVEQEYYDFYYDIADIMALIGSSKHLEYYFTEEEKSTLEEMNNVYKLGKSFEKSNIEVHRDIRVFAISSEKKSYMFSRDDMFYTDIDKIWDSDISKKAMENPRKIVSTYEKSGFTAVAKNTPVVVFAKAWSFNNDGNINMISYITIKESDIENMYSHFTSTTSDIVLLNGRNEIISSNNSAYLSNRTDLVNNLNMQLKYMIEEGVFQNEVINNGETKLYLLQRLKSADYKIMGIISPDKAFKEQYKILKLAIPTFLITSIIVIFVFIFTRQQTKPISKLVKTMSNFSKEDFRKKVVVEGTYEVRELSEAYNSMVDELDQHIRKLVQVEKDKRLTEIYALQMQINPHYMYNTLSSIKWLVWQGNVQKTIEVIDAFILLLRNIISDTDEYVTIEQEIENLKNYCFVNRVRYGDSITVDFFIMQKCLDYEIPKLILQPIVENAFFHAFPEGGKGRIDIFLKEEDGILRFNIIDNGVGIKKERLKALNSKDFEKSDGFTSIGIGNVDDRLKLLYGSDYGININATEGEGTTVTITLPKKKKEIG